MQPRPAAAPIQQHVAAAPVAAVATPINPTPEQLAKLRSELDIVNGNIKVLREMLAELHPGKEDPEDFQLLQVNCIVFLHCNPTTKKS